MPGDPITADQHIALAESLLDQMREGLPSPVKMSLQEAAAIASANAQVALAKTAREAHREAVRHNRIIESQGAHR